MTSFSIFTHSFPSLDTLPDVDRLRVHLYILKGNSGLSTLGAGFEKGKEKKEE